MVNPNDVINAMKMGVEIGQALATFLPVEQQREFTDRVIRLLQAGTTADIEGEFARAYPNGEG